MSICPNIGETITPKFSCNLWNEDLDDPIDEVYSGETLLVIASSHPKRPKRLNSNFYRFVLSPRGVAGWVHLDNCLILDLKTKI